MNTSPRTSNEIRKKELSCLDGDEPKDQAFGCQICRRGFRMVKEEVLMADGNSTDEGKAPEVMVLE